MKNDVGRRPCLKRSTHQDCPSCGVNFSEYNPEFCESCGQVFRQTQTRSRGQDQDQPPLKRARSNDGYDDGNDGASRVVKIINILKK